MRRFTTNSSESANTSPEPAPMSGKEYSPKSYPRPAQIAIGKPENLKFEPITPEERVARLKELRLLPKDHLGELDISLTRTAQAIFNQESRDQLKEQPELPGAKREVEFGKKRQKWRPRFEENKFLALFENLLSLHGKRFVHPWMVRVFAAGCMLLLFGIIGAVSWLGLKQWQKKRAFKLQQEYLAWANSGLNAKMSSEDFLNQGLKEAQTFFQARDLEQKYQLIWNGAAQKDIIDQHYAAHGLSEPMQPDYSQKKIIYRGSKALLVIPCQSASGDRRAAVFLHTDDGFRLDWSSLVTPSRQTWSQWINDGSDEVVAYRVKLAPTPEAETEVQSPELTYQLTPVEGGPTAQALVSVNSRVANELASLLTKNQQPIVTLYLQRSSRDSIARIIDLKPDKWAALLAPQS